LCTTTIAANKLGSRSSDNRTIQRATDAVYSVNNSAATSKCRFTDPDVMNEELFSSDDQSSDTQYTADLEWQSTAAAGGGGGGSSRTTGAVDGATLNDREPGTAAWTRPMNGSAIKQESDSSCWSSSELRHEMMSSRNYIRTAGAVNCTVS